MKHIKSLLLIFAIIFCTIFCSCTDTSGTGNNGGNNNQNNNTQPIYQLQTPSNARIVEYEDGDVLFFDYDINAYEFRITFFKDGTFFKRLNPNPTLSQVMLGVYLEGFEPGEYTVKIIAKANPETTDLDSVESEGMSFIIKDKTDQGGNDDPVAEKYTVSFDTNGGSSISSQQVVKGSYATKPSNPTKTGYNFVEWQLNGKTFSFTTPITSNITLKAIWEQVQQEQPSDEPSEEPSEEPSNEPTVEPSETPSTDPVEPQEPTKKGCRGTSVGLIGLISLAGALMISKKRKNN